MGFIDFFGDFERGTYRCRKCAWVGLGAAMSSGESFNDGVDKHCPKCDERWGFVQWSVATKDDSPAPQLGGSDEIA